MWLSLTMLSATPPPLPDVHPPVFTPSGRLIRYANEVSNTLNTRDRATSLLDSGLAQLVSNSIYRVSDECRAAPPGTAAVHLRLGDKPDIFARPRAPSQGPWQGPRVPIDQQVAALGCVNATIAIVGVVNYLWLVRSSELGSQPGHQAQAGYWLLEPNAAGGRLGQKTYWPDPP